jgi:hypothetical protein
MRHHRSHALRRRYGHAEGAEPWSAEDTRRYENIARRIFSESHYATDHARHPDPDNCAACAIRMGGIEGPNYAGWARLYIEARRPIPKKWKSAFEAELSSDNQAYANALRRSIATFGGPRFTGR